MITKVALPCALMLFAAGCAAPREPRVVTPPTPDRGAYDVVQRWDIPCGGYGGFGERVIVRSHKVADLIAAYHKFIAVVGSGSDRCITFIAFTSKADVAVDMAPFDQQTDAKVNAMVAHRLMYVNNPGGEEWLETPNKADPQGYVIHRIRGK